MDLPARPLSRPALRARLRPALGSGSLALWAVTALLWLLDITGHGLPAVLARACALAAVATGAAWIGASILARARRAAGDRAWAAALLLPFLLVLSLAVRFIGIGHEVEGRYYLDEGTYYHHASEINQGDVLRFSFVYPHFTYYADAFVLWLASLFPGAVARVAAGLYGAQESLAVSWLLLRGVVALLSALTVVPVFRIAERIGGLAAGGLAALLLIFSPLYNEGSHLNTCDVPSAFFATLCLLFVARLVDEESARDYLLAGVAAGLAAASKYPAGVVAVAIVAVWLPWRIARIARRSWSWGLLGAGLAAIAAFFASMPSLLFFPRQALLGGRGILFGARQYSQGGWLGVMPSSNWLFYGENLAWSFGYTALLAGIAGLVGLFVLRQDSRRRLLWLAPYPAVYLILIASMNMVVRRNLYPVVPILAVFLGLGLAALVDPLRARANGNVAKWLAPAAIALLLAVPLWRTVEQEIALSRPSTREVAAEWIRANVPLGATLVKESYTPNFQWHEYHVLQRRFAGRFSLQELRDPGNDYLLLASAAYGRFQQPEKLLKPHHRDFARVYRQVFASFPLVQRWNQGRFRLGPELRLYRIPDPPDCGGSADLPAAGAFVPDGRMRPRPKRPIQYTLEGQWAAFKGCFDTGTYRLALRGEPAGPGQVEVSALDGQRLEKVDLKTATDRGVRLPRRGKYLFYVYLPVGSKVRGLAVERR